MSTAVAERLDDLVTGEPPPCEAILTREGGRPCGKPSEFRISRECDCGIKSTRYLCLNCYTNLMVGEIHCNNCLRPIINWVLA